MSDNGGLRGQPERVQTYPHFTGVRQEPNLVPDTALCASEPVSESPAWPMPLSAPHDLAGLIAWSRRAEGQAPFGTRLDGHVGYACAGAGIKPI